tara:strand:- start:320 stop:580 length:261 start_codon:yes stop_codon:yes gene_type:complete
MGMLFKAPKYKPSQEMMDSRSAVAERDASAEVARKKELRQLAARTKAMRRDPRALLGSTGLLGIQDETPQTTQSSVRDPFNTGTYR